LFARQALTSRMGRNAAFSRAGNLTVAALSALLAWEFSPRAVFLQVPAIALLAIVAAYSIPHGSIDLRRARGLRSEENNQAGPSGWKAVVLCRPLVVFGVCNLLYGFADAPLLTIVGQQLGMKYPGWGIVLTSGLIIAAQAGMLVTALVVGRKADEWGHRWLLVAAFALLPVQAVLTVLWSDPAWLMGVQFLGNLGTGLLVALTPLLLADLMHGTGRYNLAQGAVATMRTAGVATSGLASEFAISHFGYDATYLAGGLIGVVTLALLWWAMPETSQVGRPDRPASGRDPDSRGPESREGAPDPRPNLPAPGFAPG
jgi:predicted MFS family arabinose efflux permease